MIWVEGGIHAIAMGAPHARSGGRSRSPPSRHSCCRRGQTPGSSLWPIWWPTNLSEVSSDLPHLRATGAPRPGSEPKKRRRYLGQRGPATDDCMVRLLREVVELLLHSHGRVVPAGPPKAIRRDPLTTWWCGQESAHGKRIVLFNYEASPHDGGTEELVDRPERTLPGKIAHRQADSTTQWLKDWGCGIMDASRIAANILIRRPR